MCFQRYKAYPDSSEKVNPIGVWPCLPSADTSFGESWRGNTIGATGPRASEREICLWEGLWEGGFSEILQRFLEVFRGFKRFSEVLRSFQRFQEIFERFSEVLSETLSEADFPLRGSQSCCLYSCCPLNFLQFLEDLVRNGTPQHSFRIGSMGRALPGTLAGERKRYAGQIIVELPQQSLAERHRGALPVRSSQRLQRIS